MSASDGGNAFPLTSKWLREERGNDDNFEVLEAHQGMSLRDYFAGQVMSFCCGENLSKSEAATLAYQVADEMLKARLARK